MVSNLIIVYSKNKIKINEKIKIYIKFVIINFIKSDFMLGYDDDDEN